MKMPIIFKKDWFEFFSYFVTFFCINLAWWINYNFGSPSFEQIIFHLQFGIDGLIDADYNLIISFINCLILSLIFTLLLPTIKITNHKSKRLIFCKKLYLVSLILIGTLTIFHKLAIWDYLNSSKETKFFENRYIEPNSIKSPQNKKNLILIYVESLENGFSNPKIMGQDALASLKLKNINSYSFNNYLQTYGTGWTMGGIVSTQCGVPLKTLTIFDGNQQGEKFKEFLPGITCIGDILSKNGYQNILLQGGALSFSGAGKFFTQHGYSKTLGKEYWKDLGEKNFNQWGLYDDDLLKHAKNEVERLNKSKNPYNLTLVTIDTHFPNGFVSKTCKKRGASKYQDIVKCTSDLIADFVLYIKRKGYLENTVIVIIGDHLAMGIPMHDQLEKLGHRTIFNKIITEENLVKNTETIYPFSMFPTILYAMGFRFNKNRLALGASGFGDVDPNYDITSFKSDDLYKLLSERSHKYNEFLRKK